MGRPSKENRYKKGDEIISSRLYGHVRKNGSGNTSRYVEQEFGMNYRTYLRRAKDPGTLSVSDMRIIADRCDLSDKDILAIFGR